MTGGAVANLAVVDDADYASLATFLASFPDNTHDATAWRRRLGHWWDDNPAFGDDLPRGWLLRDSQCEIVGFLGNIPRWFRVRGEDRRIACATTWRVSPTHRSASLRLYAAHMSAGKHSLLLNNTANATAAAVVEQFKYKWLPRSRTNRAYVLPTSPGRIADEYLSRRSLPRLSSLAGLALRAAAGPGMSLLRRHRSSLVRAIEPGAPEMDRLWTATRDLVAHTSVRDATAVSWFCASHGRGRLMIHGLLDGSGLKAFAIWRHMEDEGVRALELVDAWPPNIERAASLALISEASAVAAQGSADLLVVRDFGSALSHALSTARFFTRPDPNRQYFRGVFELVASDSYLTSFDGDVCL